MDSNMDWDDLQTFLVIAREGTLSGAAKSLKTTQPTMGRRLAKMEEKIGARLLERHPRGFVLTSLGETVLGNAERIEAEVINTERLITGRDKALEGVVRVTSVDVIASHVISKAVKELHKTHPKIQIEIIPDPRTLNLSKREADIAVRLTRFENNDLITKKLGTVQSAVYASKEYLEQYGTPNKENSYNHRIINVLDDYMHLPEVKAFMNQLPHAFTSIKTNSRETMLHTCIEGLGIAVLPKYKVGKNDNLIEIDIGLGKIERDVWLGVHKDMRQMPRVRAVIDAISKQFIHCEKAKNEFK